MAQYSRKTCSKCGVVRPQPEMIQREIKVKTGKSTSGFTATNYIGVMLGNQAAKRKFRQSLWSNNKRNYVRYKKVWFCKECNEDIPGVLEKSIAFVVDVVFYTALVYFTVKFMSWILT